MLKYLISLHRLYYFKCSRCLFKNSSLHAKLFDEKNKRLLRGDSNSAQISGSLTRTSPLHTFKRLENDPLLKVSTKLSVLINSKIRTAGTAEVSFLCLTKKR